MEKKQPYIKTKCGYYADYEEWKKKVGHHVVAQTEINFSLYGSDDFKIEIDLRGKKLTL